MLGTKGLLRPDLFDLVDYAVLLGVPVCLSPSVTPLLGAMTGRIARSGVRAVSVSLDGSRAQTHDGVRGIAGHFHMTIAAIAQLVDAGITVQVNTTVMDGNVDDLPGAAALVARAAWSASGQPGHDVVGGAVQPVEVTHHVHAVAQFRVAWQVAAA